MSIISESANVQTSMQAVLAAGIKVLSKSQKVLFQEYFKYTLPLDGTVYWLRSTNPPLEIEGSLHFISDKKQEVDQTVDVNRVIFSSLQEIANLNQQNSQNIFISQIIDDSGDLIQAAFSTRGSFYEQSKIWHYRGDAVYPALMTQLINDLNELPLQPMVSNSLPLFMALNQYGTTFPSFLVSDNLIPTYIVANITATEALQSSPIPFSKKSTDNPNTYNFGTAQLMQDTVEIIMYGMNNQKAIKYLNYLLDTSVNKGEFGFCSIPSITDEKYTQTELGIIALKKKMQFKVSYNQITLDSIENNLIKSAKIEIDIINNLKEV
jgi:hypothetical protein